jgi:hypothetical protein
MVISAKPAERRSHLAVAFHAAIDYLVPVGYEDETGFHYGDIAES